MNLMHLYLQNYFKIEVDNIMYLTINRNGELLSGSDEVWYNSNIDSNEFGFYCFDEHIVV